MHTGDHAELANAVEIIARYQRSVKHLDVLKVSEAKDADELAEHLTQPAVVVLFADHGTQPPDPCVGIRSTWHLEVGDIANKAARQFSAHGFIMDACYGWDFRHTIRRQSSGPLAYLAACGEAVGEHPTSFGRPLVDRPWSVAVLLDHHAEHGPAVPASPSSCHR